MPIVSQEQEQFYMDEIQQIVAFEPKASVRRINQILKHKHDLTLTANYIRKLRKKVFADNLQQLQNQNAEEEVGKYELAANHAMKKIVKILNDPTMTPGSRKIQVSIIKDILEIYRSVLQLKFDSGLLAKKLGELSVKHDLGEDELRKRVKELIGDIPDLNKS